MKADFGTLEALVGLALNSAGLAALGGLLARDEVRELVKELREAISQNLGDRRPTPEFVRRKREALGRQLFSVWMLLLHLLNLGILVALAAILVIGPQNVFDPVEGELAEPLTPAQLVVYGLWLVLNLIAYLVNGVSPTRRWWRLWCEAKAWLAKHEKQPRKKSA